MKFPESHSKLAQVPLALPLKCQLKSPSPSFSEVYASCFTIFKMFPRCVNHIYKYKYHHLCENWIALFSVQQNLLQCMTYWWNMSVAPGQKKKKILISQFQVINLVSFGYLSTEGPNISGFYILLTIYREKKKISPLIFLAIGHLLVWLSFTKQGFN